MDGKHVFIQAPANSGSLYFNYKGMFSVVLLALVDADYCFLVVDVGSYGSNSDGGIFANSVLGKALRDGTLNVPPPSELPGASELGKVNHVIVADEAFPLKPYLLRPYPGRRLPTDKRIFNYCLSRAQRISENAFSILSQHFRVFQRTLQVQPAVVDKVVKAACAIIYTRTEKTRIKSQRMTMIVSKHYKVLNIVGGSGHLWRHKMSENCTKSTSTHQQDKLLGRMTM